MHLNPAMALYCALIVGISTATLADTLIGKVVGVSDGDTITVLDTYPAVGLAQEQEELNEGSGRVLDGILSTLSAAS
ncbi:MAG: hypothetical protein HZB71_05405 [Betaproteobacteria bacterium]|nr:hypothetical protein [Betaproteobacteria bacterium]